MDNFTAQNPTNNFPVSSVPFSYSTNYKSRRRKIMMGGIFAVFAGFLAVAAFAATRLNLENRSKAGFVNYPFFEMVPMASNQTSKSYDIYLDGSGVPSTTAIHTVSLTLGMSKPAVRGASDSVDEQTESAVLGDSTTNQIADTTTIVVPMNGSGGVVTGTYNADQTTTVVISCGTNKAGCPAGTACVYPIKAPCPTGKSCAQIEQTPSCVPIKTTPTPVKPTPTVSCTPRPSCLDAKPPCRIETFANPNWCTTTPTPTQAKTTACDLKDLKTCAGGLICASPTFLPNSSMGINPTAGNCIANNGNQIDCGKDKACPSGMVCYQPSMPPCPSGMACAQVMPVAKCVNPAALKSTSVPTASVPTTSNFSVIYKDGTGTAITAYTGGSSMGIFTWDQVTANPNGLGLVLSAKIIDNANSQKALHTRFKVGNIVVPINVTPQVAAQSIRGTIAGVNTDVELYQPNLKPTVTTTTTPSPTSWISCSPSNPQSCPAGWSCLAPAPCPPANPNCGAVPPHCVQNGVVTPTVAPQTTLTGYSLSFEQDVVQKWWPMPSDQYVGISAAVWKDNDGNNVKQFKGMVTANWQFDSQYVTYRQGETQYYDQCPISSVNNRPCLYFTALVHTLKTGSSSVSLKVTDYKGGQVWNSAQLIINNQLVTPTPTSTNISCGPNKPCPNGMSCYQPTCAKDQICPQIQANMYCVPTTPTPVKPTPTVSCTPRPSCLDAKPPCRIETFANPNWCTPTPTPSKLTYCTSNANCPAGTTCYQPPMPPCPSGMACTQIMPRAYCTPATVTPTAIGGQKDEHGCLIAAGYSWCDSKQKCLRTWEESCDTVIPTPSVYKPIPTPTPSRPWYCGFIPYLCQRVYTNQ